MFIRESEGARKMYSRQLFVQVMQAKRGDLTFQNPFTTATASRSVKVHGLCKMFLSASTQVSNCYC